MVRTYTAWMGMAFEKNWSPVGPMPLLFDGDTEGTVIVTSTKGVYVKMEIFLHNSSGATLLEVKQVISKNVFKVGPKGAKLDAYSDISEFSASDSVAYSKKQLRPKIPENEYERAEFAEEPIVAKRTVAVDILGNYYGDDNPTPVRIVDGIVDGSTEIVTAEINSVPQGVEAELFRYSVPISEFVILLKMDVSGNNVATYTVRINGNFKIRKRTYFSGPLNEVIDFKELNLVPNDVVSVSVIHQRPYVGDFEISTFLSKKPI